MAGGADIRAGRAFVELFLKNSFTREFSRTLSTAKKQLADFGSAMSSMGTQMATAGAVGLMPFAASAKTFADFDDQMRQVGAVSQASGEQLASLTEKAKALGASTSFTALEVAGLMAELGRAGFDPSQIENMTGAVLDLARASKTDAVVSSGIMAATIRQFGLEAGDATRVADVLTKTANATFNSVEQLGEALKYAGPVARDLGMSLEQTLAVLGGLGNVGIQGEMAGTALRRLGILAATEGGKIKEAFGVETTDAAGNLRPMADVLREIVQAANALPSGERVKILDDIFGKQGITGAGAVGRAGVDIKSLEKDLTGDKVKGTAAGTAKAMDAGLGGSFRILTSAVEGVAITLGSALAPELIRITEAATGAATGIIEFVKANGETLVTIAKVAAGVVAAGAAFLAVGLGASFLASAIGGFLAIGSAMSAVVGGIVTVLAAIASPIGVAVLAVVALVDAFFRFTDAGAQLKATFAAAFGGLIDLVKGTLGGIVDALAEGKIGKAADIAMAGLNLAFRRGLNGIHEMWIDLKYFVFDTLAEMASFAQPIMNMLAAAGGKEMRFGIGSLSIGSSDYTAEGRAANKEREKRAFDDGLAAAESDFAEQTRKPKKFAPYVPDMSLPGDPKKPQAVEAKGGAKPVAPTSAVSVAVTGAAFAALAGGGKGVRDRAITIAEQQRELAKKQLEQQQAMAQALKDFNTLH